MRRLFLALSLLAALACKGPQAAPLPKASARLTVHFLDQDAVLGLDRPMPGPWSFMDAGLWRGLDTVWTDREGRAAVGRTAPPWVLLKDPEGGVHRIKLSEAPEAIPDATRPDREDAEDQAEGLLILWLWFSHVFVGR